MRRRHYKAWTAAVLLLAIAVGLAGPTLCGAEEEEEAKTFALSDLDAKAARELVDPMRAYLDPETEFLWRPRKDLLAALGVLGEKHGVDPLKDVGLLRRIIYQGRHFKQRFADKKWQRVNDVTEFKKTSSIYFNLKSEQSQFTYTLPKGYPKERAFEKILRPSPYPLLISVHEERDTANARGDAAKFPGEVCLKRRYPKGDFGALYENWFTLAPVAPRAKFLQEDGRVRHRFLTLVLTDFWRRYHIDFDRIVIDGTEPAATLAAMFPQIFAGLVLRGGKIDPEVVKNFAGVPVFVVDAPKLKKMLDDAGHPDVTTGSARDAIVWMNQRERTVPSEFDWNVVLADQLYPQWVTINGADFSAPARKLSVKVLDTEEDPNTIKVDAEGIEQISLFLNDLHVDLDREIRLVLNGHEEKHEAPGRNLDQVFTREPIVRVSMNFSWLYPAVIENVKIPAPKEVEEAPTEVTPPTEEGPKGSPEAEEEAKGHWERAVKAESDGSTAKARTFYEKVVDVGETSYKAKAEAKLLELE